MKDPILTSALAIDDSRTAAVFGDALRRRIVLLLAGNERSIADLAAETGYDLKRLHYHVTALKALGLVRVVREQARSGRPIKMYRAVADAFFVPASVAQVGPGIALSRELRAALERVQQASQSGMLYCRRADGEPEMRSVQTREGRGPLATETWQVLRLSRAEARALADEIASCVGRASKRASGAGTYLVHFAIAPREDG